MNNSIIGVLGICIGMYFAPDDNKTLTYGDTGFPKNCRAIVAANIAGWRAKAYSADDALDAIDRNCGAAGYSWSGGRAISPLELPAALRN